MYSVVSGVTDGTGMTLPPRLLGGALHVQVSESDGMCMYFCSRALGVSLPHRSTSTAPGCDEPNHPSYM